MVGMATMTFLCGDWCVRWLSCCNGETRSAGVMEVLVTCLLLFRG